MYLRGSADRKITPTEYAVASGAYQYSGSDSRRTGYCFWWLRSPGIFSKNVSNVISSGALDCTTPLSKDGCIRPAFWLDLNSADIYGADITTDAVIDAVSSNNVT